MKKNEVSKVEVKIAQLIAAGAVVGVFFLFGKIISYARRMLGDDLALPILFIVTFFGISMLMLTVGDDGEYEDEDSEEDYFGD